MKRGRRPVEVTAMSDKPARRFTLALLLVLVALVAVQVVTAASERSASRAADSQVKLARNVEQIRYYDELLTMSARLAAATGDMSYVERYRHAAQELDRVIREAQRRAPDRAADDAVHATDRANQALIALEETSFTQLASGNRAGAYATLNGGAYAELKADYRRSLNVAGDRMELGAARRRARASHLRLISLVARLSVVTFVALLWAATARSLRRSERIRIGVEDRLRIQAHADPLTGLANRRLFRDQLTAALARPEEGELAVLFADLDHFKSVNDARGHAVGDALLVEVAGRVTALMNDHPDGVVARMGGDELAVLLPATGERAAEKFAEQLVSTLSQPYKSVPLMPVSVSVGLAVTSPDERDAVALLRSADLAMYDAKSGGRGRWSRYVRHMQTELLARLAHENRMSEEDLAGIEPAFGQSTT